MGFRSGFVISSVSFLFGVIFIASIYDFPMLFYSPLEPSSVEAAEKFYLSMFNGPTAIPALLHGMVALGLIGLIAKLHRWTEMAKYFDGGSLVLFMGAVCMYGGVTIPNIKLLNDPTNESLISRSALQTQREAQASLFTSSEGKAQPPPTGPMTPDERVSTIRILGATNVICVALLAGVVILQVSEWWMERSEKLEAEQRRQKAAAALSKVGAESKKDQ
ncbi:hypothetical protein IE53DRAFT_405197 [Violaceomyces palustris]|uniref:Uncharacterized protein n=1 Tax=Violaceomyces palustris TaxID=1673888 RepID=A0ACD0P2W5_9BASI|nr:hypothetical protein IE53DRAFT_405197 [Violaceomyces palustris]